MFIYYKIKRIGNVPCWLDKELGNAEGQDAGKLLGNG